MTPAGVRPELPRRAAEELRRLGWEVVHVGELGLHRAEDPAILDLAVSRGAAVVTLDGDFGGVLAATQATSPSVVHVRIEPFNAAEGSGSLAAGGRRVSRCAPIALRRVGKGDWEPLAVIADEGA